MYRKITFPIICLFFLASQFSFGHPDSVRSRSRIDFESSNLPLILINTGDMDIPYDSKITADMGIIDNAGARKYFDDPFNGYNGEIGIKIRASSS
jgi:hypothetical protein